MHYTIHMPNVEILRSVAGALHHSYAQCGDTQESCRCIIPFICPMWRYSGELQVHYTIHMPNVEILRRVAGALYHSYAQCGDTQESCRCIIPFICPMWRYSGELQVHYTIHMPNVEILRRVAGALHQSYAQCGDTQESCRCIIPFICPMWRYPGELQVHYTIHMPNVEILRSVAGALYHSYAQCGDTQESCRCIIPFICPMWRYSGELQVHYTSHMPNVEILRSVAGALHHSYAQCGDTQECCRCIIPFICPMWRYSGVLQVHYTIHMPNVEILWRVAGALRHSYAQCRDTQESCRCIIPFICPMWRYSGELQVHYAIHMPNVEILRRVAGALHHSYAQCGDTQESCRCITPFICPMWRYSGVLQVHYTIDMPNVEILRRVAGALYHSYAQCLDTQ